MQQIPLSSAFNYPLAQGINSSKLRGTNNESVNGIVRHSSKREGSPKNRITPAQNGFSPANMNTISPMHNTMQNTVPSPIRQTVPTAFNQNGSQGHLPANLIPQPLMISPVRMQNVETERMIALLRNENENLKRQLAAYALQIQALQAEFRSNANFDSKSASIINEPLIHNQLLAQNISLNTKDTEIIHLKAELKNAEVAVEENFKLKSEVIALSSLVEELQKKNATQEALLLNNGKCYHDDELIKENMDKLEKVKAKLLKKKAKHKLLKSEYKTLKSSNPPSSEISVLQAKVRSLQEIEEKYNSMMVMFVSVNAELEALRGRVGEPKGEEKQIFRRTSGHFMDSEILTKDQITFSQKKLSA